MLIIFFSPFKKPFSVFLISGLYPVFFNSFKNEVIVREVLSLCVLSVVSYVFFSRILLHELVERGFKINKNKIRMNNLEEITAYK